MMKRSYFFQVAGKALGLCLWVFVLALPPVSCTKEPVPDPGGKDTTYTKGSAYSAALMTIKTENGQKVISKDPADYVNCTVKIDGLGYYDDYSGTARIRCRGNSSFEWYDKKPYRIKLDQKSKILGLGANSDWVLLANYRDPTDMMNVLGFDMCEFLGISYPNHTRFVEVTLNGDYIGVYQLTEQVEQGSNRVDISKEGGYLICLDLDDGPSLSPSATDNFWSDRYELPICVKFPDQPTSADLNEVKAEFAKLEEAISEADYDAVAKLMDIPSMINYLILQEFVYNVEIDAPRSTFMFKDANGLWTWGPGWDFDAGFDFDWGNMYTGHDYFSAQELVLGTDPANHTGGYRISDFFTDMFKNKRFVEEYKERWNAVKDKIMPHWLELEGKYRNALTDAFDREAVRWPIHKNWEDEMKNMDKWLSDRVGVLTSVIAGYPAGTPVITKTEDCGTLSYDCEMKYSLGYHQDQGGISVKVSEADVVKKFGVTASTFNDAILLGNVKIVPLRTDGNVGDNNTNGTYGGWFESDGNPGVWGSATTYIEIFQDYFTWNVGLNQSTCPAGSTNKVRMQYRYVVGETLKTLTVTVNFTVV
jgi:hypothetical protein